jgi:hypothetical protein
MTKLTEQIQRYNVVHMPPKGERTMQPFEHGMWVRTTDHLEALARLSEQQAGALTDVLMAAGHALRSYQCGNASTELAEEVADRIFAALAQRTPATAPAPQSADRMYSNAEIEKAMTAIWNMYLQKPNEIAPFVRFVLARLSAREQPSKEQPVI